MTKLNAPFKSKLFVIGVEALASLALIPTALKAQSIDLRYDPLANAVHLEVDTTLTEPFWIAESADLIGWNNLTFVDGSTSIDLGAPEPNARFFRPAPLYGRISWSETVDMPAARDQFTGGLIDGKLYLFGGNGNPDGTNLSRLDIYDLATAQWSRGTDYHFGIEELSSAVLEGRLYLFGGYAGEGPTHINLRYDPESDAWSELTPKPTPIQTTTAVVWRDEIVTVGAFLGDDLGLTPIVEAYHPSSDTWRHVTNLPYVSEHAAVAIHDDVLYVIGGVDLETLTLHNKLRRFDLIQETWLPAFDGILPHPIIAVYTSACPVVNGKMIIGGGIITKNGAFTFTNPETDAAISNLTTIYDIQSQTFSQNTPLPEPLHGHLFLLAEDSIVALGGRGDLSGDDATRSNRMHIGVFEPLE